MPIFHNGCQCRQNTNHISKPRQHVPIPMRFAHCTYGGKRPCCSAHFCPLVPAWASTIHKFQGFEAGKDDWDLIKTLIIDCGPINAEWLTPGLLYVAASRGKTWGSMSKSNPRPTDSAIYFDKEGMGENRVRHVAVHQKKVSKDNFQWVKNKNVQKRDMWVKFLCKKQKRQSETITRRKK